MTKDKVDGESETMSEDKFDDVLKILKQTFGSDNITVINSGDDIEKFRLELELRDYLRSGGRLN